MALSFDAVDDMVTFTAVEAPHHDLGWSFWGWTRPDTAGGEGGNGVVLTFESANPGTTRQSLRFAGSRRLFCYQDFSTTDAQTTAAAGSALAVAYTFVVGTFDPTDNKCRIYAGTLTTPMAELSYSSQTAGVGTRQPNGLYATIGNRRDGSTTWGGRLGEIGYCSRVLTLAEMERLRQGWRPTFTKVSRDNLAPRGTVASTQNKTAQTSTSVALINPTDIQVGETLLMRVVSDNNPTGGTVVTPSDPRSNTWTLRTSGNRTAGAANDGVTVRLFQCDVTTPYQAGDAITLNYGASITSKTVIIERWPKLKFISATTGAGNLGGLNLSITPQQQRALVYGVFGMENGGTTYTKDTDSTNGATWQDLDALATATNTSSDIAQKAQYKTNPTMSGGQTWDVSTSTGDVAGVLAIFAPDDGSREGVQLYAPLDSPNIVAQDLSGMNNTLTVVGAVYGQDPSASFHW